MSAMVGVGDHANRDEGARCLHIAEQALQAGDIAKATRFAEKAMRLYPNDEVMGVRASHGVVRAPSPGWSALVWLLARQNEAQPPLT